MEWRAFLRTRFLPLSLYFTTGEWQPATSDRFLTRFLTKCSRLVPMEGVEPTHSHEYQILSLARLPIPPHRPPAKSMFSTASPLSFFPLHPAIVPRRF